MKLFPDPEYSEEEMNIIKLHLSNPLVVKYIKGLAQVSVTDMATTLERLEIEDPIKYQVKNATVLGAISALSDLLDIATEAPIINL